MDGKITSSDINIIDGHFENKLDFLTAVSKFIASRINCDYQQLLVGFLQREEESNTAIGEGFAIPHAVIEGVAESRVFLHIIDQGVNYEAFDDQQVKVAFSLIIAKEHYNEHHLRQLSSIAMSLMDEKNQAILKTEKDKKILCEVVNRMGEQL